MLRNAPALRKEILLELGNKSFRNSGSIPSGIWIIFFLIPNKKVENILKKIEMDSIKNSDRIPSINREELFSEFVRNLPKLGNNS